MGKTPMLLIAAVLCAWTASGRAGELVVIASSDPAIEKGVVFDGGKPLRVASGATVVLISSKGKTIKLAGPHTGVPDADPADGDSKLVDSLSHLIKKQAQSPSTLAVYRSGLGQPPEGRPDIWGVDLARGGTYCLRADRSAVLWWEAAGPGASVRLAPGGEDAGGVRIKWPRGKHHVPWPRELALSDGADYVVRLWSGDEGQHVTTRLMPELETDAHRAAWMAEHDCTVQALMVLDALGGEAL